MKRHSDKLSLRKSRIYEVNRDGDRDESILQKFYDEVQRVIAAFEFTDEDVWNLDETGVTAQGKTAGKVIAEKGAQTAGTKRSNVRENVSLLVAINAAGKSLPPLYIFKGKKLNKECVVGAPAGSRFTTSDTSFINSDIFFQWLQHFVEALPAANRMRKQLIFFDGHRRSNQLGS